MHYQLSHKSSDRFGLLPTAQCRPASYGIHIAPLKGMIGLKQVGGEDGASMTLGQDCRERGEMSLSQHG